MKRQSLPVLLAACGMLVTGCGEPVEPDALLSVDLSRLPIAEEPLVGGRASLRVARVGTFADSAIVAVAGTAKVGEPVQVQVTTYGGGCVAEDTTVARVRGLQASVVPYQRVRTGGVCTRELRVTRRVVPVVFNAAGLAVVTVIGRGPSDDRLMQFVRAVTVRP